jgi:Ca2+:H+ antiporter
MIMGKYLNVLLLFLPLGLGARVLEWGPGPVFFLNFVALIPLASMLGDLTEEVADYMGDTGGREGGRDGGREGAEEG